MITLKTGELAKQAGVNVETLRFYERKGILPKPPRRQSGYREYPPEAATLVRFVKRAQELGFSLRQIKGLLELRQVPRATCTDVRKIATEKIADIEARIHDLEAMKAALSRLVRACSGRGPIAACPIIEALVNDERRMESRLPNETSNRAAGLGMATRPVLKKRNFKDAS
jgi:Hg(II)-responsive transcriptional regulator